MATSTATKMEGVEAYQARVSSENRTRILEAAECEFFESGYAGTSLERVARRAELSTATVYRHFPTKASLFVATSVWSWENVRNRALDATPAGNPEQGLTMIGRDCARLLREPRIEALFRVVIAEARQFPDLGREMHEAGHSVYVDPLRAYLELEIAAGTIICEDVGVLVRQFLGMIHDSILWPRFLVVDLEISEAFAEEIVTDAVKTILARYGAPKKA